MRRNRASNFRKMARDSPEVWSYSGESWIIASCRRRSAAMHRVGVLVALFPEFGSRLLVISRFITIATRVDEHSLVAIENVHALRTPDSELERVSATF